MKSWEKIFILVCFLSFSAAAQTTEPGTQIITSEELEASGITVLSDMFQLFDKWNISSIDGFNWEVSSNGLSPFQRQRFKLMIDGNPVDLNIMDNQNINLLPFSVNQIDYIEVISSPKIISGDFADGGFVDIHLKAPKPKLTSHFVYSTGNETGDPGPFKFTPYSSENVDKINNVLAGDLNYASRNWNLMAGLKSEENFDTDLRIKKRMHSSEKARLTSGFGRLSISTLNGFHNILAFYSDQKDYFQLPYLGNEIPASRIVSFAGINGHLQLNHRTKFNYLLQSGRNKLSQWEGPDPGWNNIKLRSDIGLEYRLNHFILNGGVSLRKNLLETGDDLLQNSITFRNYYLELKYIPGRNSSHEISFYSVNYKDKNTFKVVLSNSLNINNYNTLSLSVSFFTRMLEEDLNYWSWNLNGYKYDQEKSWICKYDDFKDSRNLTGDLTYRYKPDSSLTAEAGLFYRRFQNQYLEDQYFYYFDFDNTYFTSNLVMPLNDFSEGGINLVLTHQLLNKLSYSLKYTYRNPLEGDLLFRKIWEAFPAHKAALDLNYAPAPDFGIWSRLSYFSHSKWSQYAYVQYQSNIFEPVIKNGIIWDLALKKYFAGRMIRTNIVLRNLLNQKEYYNPVGAEFNLRLFVQIIINLDNLPE